MAEWLLHLVVVAQVQFQQLLLLLLLCSLQLLLLAQVAQLLLLQLLLAQLLSPLQLLAVVVVSVAELACSVEPVWVAAEFVAVADAARLQQ